MTAHGIAAIADNSVRRRFATIARQRDAPQAFALWTKVGKMANHLRAAVWVCQIWQPRRRQAVTYDLEAIRSAVAKATAGEWKLKRDIGKDCTNIFVEKIMSQRTFPKLVVSGCVPMTPYELSATCDLMNAARSGLLEDAAIGRAVRAAAERDGPEREAMADAMFRDSEKGSI